MKPGKHLEQFAGLFRGKTDTVVCQSQLALARRVGCRLPGERDVCNFTGATELERVVQQMGQQLTQQVCVCPQQRHVLRQLPLHLAAKLLLHQRVGHRMHQRRHIHRLALHRLLPQSGQHRQPVKLLRQQLGRLTNGGQVAQNVGRRIGQVFCNHLRKGVDVAQRRTQIMRHGVHKFLKLGPHMGQLILKPLNLCGLNRLHVTLVRRSRGHLWCLCSHAAAFTWWGASSFECSAAAHAPR